MKRKGFTLIELLAVIVILAIIALIAVPTILNIINNAKKSAFKDSVYGIIKSGELYYTNKMMEESGMTEDKAFTFPEANGLEVKGSKPASGTMIITKEGKVGIAVSNGKYCAKKGYSNQDITVDENINNCEIPSILTSQNTCVKDKNVTCDNGTEVTVQVNSNTSYNFYVIKDTGSELTLIMDRNLGDVVAWVNQTDYLEAGGNLIDYGDWGKNDKGALTALNYLESQTSNWTNIPLKNNVKARMLTYTEATALYLDNNLPGYLYTKLSTSNTAEEPYSYWLVSADGDDLSAAANINYNGIIGKNYVANNMNSGVRPVIVLSKAM